MNPMTRALHTRVDCTGARPAVTPLYQNSAFEAGSPWFYARKDHPNGAELEQAVAVLEGAKHGIAVSTGMAAIRACLDLLRPQDTVVLNTLVYGCTWRQFHRVAAQWQLNLHLLDLSTAAGRAAVPANTKLVFFETPTNPFLFTVDIRAVVEAVRAQSPQAVIVVDNTWATPLYQRPLALGADVSLHSATKYLSGHSDVMGGLLLVDRDDLAEELRATRFYSGAVLDPHSAWLLRRSLQTLEVRVAQQSRNTLKVMDFLRTQPQVARVYYPEIDGQQLTGYGSILFFELHAEQCYPDFLAGLDLFSSGTGMAAVTSMVAQPWTGSHASMTEAEKKAAGIGPGLVRLCIGLEDPAALCESLSRAFSRLG